jgi:beta-lactamase superfamily II metal-dependent hydrolase
MDGKKLLAKNPNLFGEQLKDARAVILVAPHHGRRSGYSQSMIDYFKPDLVVISDGYGAGETDARFRTCATGLEIKGVQTKCITTKTKGRKRMTISANGALNIHEADL